MNETERKCYVALATEKDLIDLAADPRPLNWSALVDRQDNNSFIGAEVATSPTLISVFLDWLSTEESIATWPSGNWISSMAPWFPHLKRRLEEDGYEILLFAPSSRASELIKSLDRRGIDENAFDLIAQSYALGPEYEHMVYVSAYRWLRAALEHAAKSHGHALLIANLT